MHRFHVTEDLNTVVHIQAFTTPPCLWMFSWADDVTGLVHWSTNIPCVLQPCRRGHEHNIRYTCLHETLCTLTQQICSVEAYWPSLKERRCVDVSGGFVLSLLLFGFHSLFLIFSCFTFSFEMPNSLSLRPSCFFLCSHAQFLPFHLLSLSLPRPPPSHPPGWCLQLNLANVTRYWLLLIFIMFVNMFSSRAINLPC